MLSFIDAILFFMNSITVFFSLIGSLAGAETWQVEQSHLIPFMAPPPSSALSPLRERRGSVK